MSRYGRPRLLWAGALMIVVAAVVTTMGMRCFRTVQVDNPALGILRHEFRWCKLREITCDANRDGTVDGRYTVIGRDGGITTAVTPTEGWESVDFDGIMNAHYYYEGEGPGRQMILELDLDKDGRFEEWLTGEAAEHRLQSLRETSQDHGSADSHGP